jgi:uncharacterized membrane protein
MRKGHILLVLLFVSILASVSIAYGQEETFEGRVTRILKEEVLTLDGQQALHQEVEIFVTNGLLQGRTIIVDVGGQPSVAQLRYKVGDKVLVSRGPGAEGQEVFVITDFVRRDALLWLLVIFAIVTGLVARWQGMYSLLGLGLSFFVIFKFILPNINAGYDPVLIVIIGSLMIAPITFYISHGFNKKTTMAIVGTLLALLITGLLAKVFVDAAQLSGYVSEEAGFLQVARQGTLNVKGILLAGIIIGALGVLDDITISQAAIIQQLKEADPDMLATELFTRSMTVGHDHIAAVVNTLVLVYTGAALPLLLLFVDNPRPFAEVINYEIISEEIVRTLVGSIGLISAVPITTLLAIWFVDKDDPPGRHSHDHHPEHEEVPRKARRLKAPRHL